MRGLVFTTVLAAVLAAGLARQRFRQAERASVTRRARGDCSFQGDRVCNGAVLQTYRFHSLVRVCEDGELVVKPTSQVEQAALRASQRRETKQDCTWYGEAFCHGDTVIVSSAT